MKDMNLFMSKGLCDENGLNDRYCNLYINYKILLERYLFERLSLKQYDDRLCNSELSFVPVKKENMDFYQFFSTMRLKYIYLRNDLSVEKLSLEDIDLLVNLSSNQPIKQSKELFQLVERTYRNVIDSRTNMDIKLINGYGSDRKKFWIDSTELVFGVRYDKFLNDGTKSDTEWRYNYFRQTDYINELLLEMSNNCSKIIGFKVNFLQYNDFTVKNSTRYMDNERFAKLSETYEANQKKIGACSGYHTETKTGPRSES